MVQVTFDTNNDSLEELEHTLLILQKAIAKHTGAEVQAPTLKNSEPVVNKKIQEEKEEDDTPFIKITIKHDDDEDDEKKHADKKEHENKHSLQENDEHHPKNVPTLNQLINDASITEEELSSLFKGPAEHKAGHETKEVKKHHSEDDNSGSTSYLEIIEYEDEKK